MRIEEKEWDSEVFGVRCGKVHCDAYDKSIKTDGWDFLHARAGVGEADCMATLKKAGFRKVADYMTLSRDLTAHPPVVSGIDFSWREATEDDAEYVGGLAAQIFVYDRCHADNRIPRKVVDAYKRIWAENLCRGRAEAVFVATDLRYGIIGFSSIHGSFVGLNGVHPKFRRLGIGFGLVELACQRLVYLGCEYALVSTQRANVPAIDMYYKSHFRIQEMAHDFHWIRKELEWG